MNPEFVGIGAFVVFYGLLRQMLPNGRWSEGSRGLFGKRMTFPGIIIAMFGDSSLSPA